MNTRCLQIALLFIIVFLSNIAAIAIELFLMMGELYAAAVANPLTPTLTAEFTDIAKALNDPTLPWMLTIILGLNLLIPLMAIQKGRRSLIAFNHRLSAWIIFVFGSLVTAFGTFHSLEHVMSGEIYAVVLTLLTLTLPGIYGCVLAYRLARSSSTKTPSKEMQNV